MMKTGMLSIVWKDLQIFRSIVVAVSITVMNNFFGEQRSSYNLLCDNPVRWFAVDL